MVSVILKRPRFALKDLGEPRAASQFLRRINRALGSRPNKCPFHPNLQSLS